jgi:hypothetical protein
MSAGRYALIIASDQYKDVGLRRLVAPSHDAEALAAALRDPAVGNFEADVVVNQTSHDVRCRIEAFFRDRRRDDLLLLYFSGHGLKDETGRLFLAMTDTERRLLNATAVPARFVQDAIEQTRSLRSVLLLDCCYGGAFARGLSSKGDPSVHLNDRFGATGSVLLTSSNEVEYAFEDEKLVGEATASVFTRILVEGLRSGAADANCDGYIDVDELYDYVRDRMMDERPEQRPNRWDLGVDGRILVARNPNWQLPQIILDEMGNPMSTYRARAVEDLVKLCRQGNELVKGRVREALLELADDDSRKVTRAAEAALAQLFPDHAARDRDVTDPAAQPIPTAVEIPPAPRSAPVPMPAPAPAPSAGTAASSTAPTMHTVSPPAPRHSDTSSPPSPAPAAATAPRPPLPRMDPAPAEKSPVGPPPPRRPDEPVLPFERSGDAPRYDDHHPPARSPWRSWTPAVVVALIVALVGLVVVVTRSGGTPVAAATTSPTTVTTPQQPSQTTTPPTSSTSSGPAPTAPSSATATPRRSTAPYRSLTLTGRFCGRSGNGPYAAVAVGNDHTTCEFASNMRDAYISSGAQGAPIRLSVYSPRTHKWYDMTCSGDQPVRCTGGNDAIIYLYGGEATFKK